MGWVEIFPAPQLYLSRFEGFLFSRILRNQINEEVVWGHVHILLLCWHQENWIIQPPFFNSALLSLLNLVSTASSTRDKTLKYFFFSSECDQHRYPWRKYCGYKVLPGVFVSRCNSTCMQIVLNSGILTNRIATGFQATVRASDEGKLMRSPRSLTRSPVQFYSSPLSRNQRSWESLLGVSLRDGRQNNQNWSDKYIKS